MPDDAAIRRSFWVALGIVLLGVLLLWGGIVNSTLAGSSVVGRVLGFVPGTLVTGVGLWVLLSLWWEWRRKLTARTPK
jgi:hypothetical protein